MSPYRKNANHYSHSTPFTPYQQYYEKEAHRILTLLSQEFNKKHVKALIDESLDNRDEKLFYQLTSLYKQLLAN
ncbi:IDEAL domain-containing protein [Priestia megaterium]|nr:IDEAL domain-containing protein [Priestia megaterium]